MKSQLDNLPRYSTEEVTLAAPLFNKVKLGLLRLNNPLIFAIHGLRHLDVVLDHETWICRDVSLNNMPVLAWTDFSMAKRNSLCESVTCSLYTYHAHALLISDTILEQIDIEISNRLPCSQNSAEIRSIK